MQVYEAYKYCKKGDIYRAFPWFSAVYTKTLYFKTLHFNTVFSLQKNNINPSAFTLRIK